MIHFHSGNENFCGTADQFRAFSIDEKDLTCTVCLENLHYRLGQRINKLKGIQHDDNHETDYGPYCLTCEQLGAV